MELQWPKQTVTMKTNSSQRLFQPSKVSFYINLNSRDSSPIHETSAIRTSVLLFSFSIFRDRRSLKIENENKSKVTAGHKK